MSRGRRRIGTVLLLCATPGLACAALQNTQPPQPGIENAVAVVLQGINTSNGPLTEIVSDPDCTGPGNSTHAPAIPCASTVGDSAIRRFSMERKLRLVRESDPLPLCRWVREDRQGERGLRVIAMRPRAVEGGVRISVHLTCNEPPARFGEVGVYELGVVNGTWKVTRIIDRSVS